MNIVGQSFKPIPTSNEYFYFYNSARRQTTVDTSLHSSFLLKMIYFMHHYC